MKSVRLLMVVLIGALCSSLSMTSGRELDKKALLPTTENKKAVEDAKKAADDKAAEAKKAEEKKLAEAPKTEMYIGSMCVEVQGKVKFIRCKQGVVQFIPAEGSKMRIIVWNEGSYPRRFQFMILHGNLIDANHRLTVREAEDGKWASHTINLAATPAHTVVIMIEAEEI